MVAGRASIGAFTGAALSLNASVIAVSRVQTSAHSWRIERTLSETDAGLIAINQTARDKV
jgi:hypothetical protein